LCCAERWLSAVLPGAESGDCDPEGATNAKSVDLFGEE
jgi:hypothetical protein